MKARDFEASVLVREGIVVRVRASVTAEVEDYAYTRQASAETSVTEWLDTRIRDKLRENEISVIDGNGNEVHGRTKLKTLRATYARE